MHFEVTVKISWKHSESTAVVEVRRESWQRNFGEWFRTVLSEAGIIDYRYPIKGCGTWLPYGFKLRKLVLDAVREELDRAGHQEVLFPLLIPEDFLAREAEHVKSFEGESFWITRAGHRELSSKLALRPTSEAAITPMVKLWAKSHAQLPMKLYQIVSMFRYETKATRPLLRVREVTTFKEAHTFHATHDEALAQIRKATQIYKRIFTKLRIPHVISQRPAWDKFPGAEVSIAFDTVMPDGRALQIGTVHDLGQRFSRAFDATFETIDGKQEFYWQTSYGISERVIASIVAMHGDDHGAVLPPSVAPIQVVAVPVIYRGLKRAVLKACKQVIERLEQAGLRAEADLREGLTPGAKFYGWEMKGVPLRIEIGPRDIAEGTVTLVKRHDLSRSTCKSEEAVQAVKKALQEIENELWKRSLLWFRQRVSRAKTLKEAREALARKQGIVQLPWCGNEECGLSMEEKVGASVLGRALDARLIDAPCPVCKGKPEAVIRLAKKY